MSKHVSNFDASLGSKYDAHVAGNDSLMVAHNHKLYRPATEAEKGSVVNYANIPGAGATENDTDTGDWISLVGNDAGVYELALHESDAEWTQLTPIPNEAELQAVVNMVSASAKYYAVRLPPKADFILQNDIVVPGNVEIDLNGSNITSRIGNNQIFDITASNVIIRNATFALNEDDLQRVIRVRNEADNVKIYDMHATGSVDATATDANSFVEFIRSGTGTGLVVERCSARNMRHFHHCTGTRNAIFTQCTATDMGGPFAWWTGAAENLTYRDCHFNRHLNARVLNNAFASEGEGANPVQKKRIMLIDCTATGVEGVQYDFEKEPDGTYSVDENGKRIPLTNGASGDMIVFRNCIDSHMLRCRVSHSGEFGYDLVHGCLDCTIIDCLAEDISAAAYTMGARYSPSETIANGGALQTPTRRCRIVNCSAVRVALNQLSKVGSDELSAFRFDNTEDCTIASCTVDGAGLVGTEYMANGIGFSFSKRVMNYGGHNIKNVGVPVKDILENSFTDGYSTQDYSQRTAAGFIGTGAFQEQEHRQNIETVANNTAPGTYLVTTDTFIPEDAVLSVRLVAATIKTAEITRIDGRTIEVKTYGYTTGTAELSNTIFTLIIETLPGGFVARPIVVDVDGEIYDSDMFWNKLPSLSSSVGVRARAYNFVVPNGMEMADSVELVVQNVTNEFGDTSKQWVPVHPIVKLDAIENDITPTSVENSDVISTVYSKTVYANTLKTIKASLFSEIENQQGANQRLNITIQYGGITIFSGDTGQISSQPNNRTMQLDIDVQSLAANSQSVFVKAMIGNPTGNSLLTDEIIANGALSATIAADDSVDNNLVVRYKWAVADAALKATLVRSRTNISV